jgi:biotin operon repressor
MTPIYSPASLLQSLRVSNAYGKENAIHGAKLARQSEGTSEKTVQVHATELRRQGYLIGACDKGFFICMTYDEALEYVQTLEKRVEGANKTISAFWKGMNEAFPNDKQTEMNL